MKKERVADMIVNSLKPEIPVFWCSIYKFIYSLG